MQAQRYLPGLAARHVVRGMWAPRTALREALVSRLGEPGRVLLLSLATAALALADPTARSFWPDLASIAGEEDVPLAVIDLAAALVVLLGIVLLYWLLAGLLMLVCGLGMRTRPAFRPMRSVVVLATWFGLVPMVAATVVAALLLPEKVVAAERFNALTIVVVIVGIPYLAVCLSEAFRIETRRSFGVSAFVNLILYLAIEVVSYALETSGGAS